MKIKKVSDQQEKRTAKDFGGRTRPGSGNKDHAKGDAITGKTEAGKFNSNDFLIENKFTYESFYTLKLETWQKIAKEALRENMRTPLMQIDIAKGTPVETHLIVMDKQDFIGLELDKVFVDLHDSNTVESKSFRLHALELHMKYNRDKKHRVQYVCKAARKILVALNLEEFKECIAIS